MNSDRYSFTTQNALENHNKLMATTTLYELYQQHIEQQSDERETVLKAQTLHPNSWQKIYTLMNSTIKQQGTAK